MSTAENNLECEDYSIMCRLPNEILTHIFAILRLRDRKSVRLVCRSWYQYSTCVSITKNEKFVFHRTVSSIEDVTKVMLNANFFSLELQNYSIDALPADIWKVCGHQIRSLKLFCCCADADTIRNIVIHCENLISFTFKTSDTELGKKIFCSSQLFDELVEKGIQRKKLRTFAMLISDPLEEIVLSKLFLVYPCITHFVAKTLSHQWFSYFPLSLESLKFKRAPRESKKWMTACITKSEQGLRLRHLNGMFDNMNESYMNESLLNFFSSQKDLIEVTLRIKGGYNDQSIKNITFQILECCPSLQEFRISLFDYQPTVLYLEKKEFSRFVDLISKLRCLNLWFYVSEPRSSLFPKLTYLTTLEWSLGHCQIPDDLYGTFFENCPSLLHLRLNNYFSNDHTLQAIFKYLLKLQTLELWVFDNCTNYGFTGHSASKERGYSIKRLQQLKHLYIDGGLGCVQGVEEIVLEFQFPHLEYLRLDAAIVKMLSEEAMIHLSRHIPNLKLLDMFNKDEGILTVEIVNFCKYLKNLHGLFTYLHWDYDLFHYTVCEQSEELFLLCPSLRFIVTVSDGLTFCFNPLTNEMEFVRCIKNHKKLIDSIFEGL